VAGEELSTIGPIFAIQWPLIFPRVNPRLMPLSSKSKMSSNLLFLLKINWIPWVLRQPTVFPAHGQGRCLPQSRKNVNIHIHNRPIF
jgi:hypothetical protein